MDKIVEKNLLYDFYGELLTDHQKKIYEDAVYGDFSLSELAEEYGISRQGVHDLLKRCDKILEEYEDILHMIERFEILRKDVLRIEEIAEKLEEDESKEIVSLTKHIKQNL